MLSMMYGHYSSNEPSATYMYITEKTSATYWQTGMSLAMRKDIDTRMNAPKHTGSWLMG